MVTRPSFFITTPIYYVNAVPHIGHAYSGLACDVLARFKRLDGFDMHFLTGTDEHGQKVETAARQCNIETRAYCDQVSKNFQDLARAMKFSNDDFIRTTQERHYKGCQALWRVLDQAGQIYQNSYSGWYSVSDEAYYDAEEISDDGKGSKIAPTGSRVAWIEEPSYFFRLSNWQQPLLDFYAENPDFVQPESRHNEVLRFVESGLQDLSISRTKFSWGIPVPDDPDHVMYVWVDALTNYITALGYPDTSDARFQKFWPADVHVIGKEILRFHAVYWPAMLMAAKLELPRRVYAHGLLMRDGRKMSKSIGNVVTAQEMIQRIGLDALRYFLMREVPFGQDGTYSDQTMYNRLNSDLANDLGNLCQRTLSIVAKHCAAQVPTPSVLTPEDEVLLKRAAALPATVRELMDAMAYHRALSSVMAVASEANRYINAMAPWVLRKTDPERMATVLYVIMETLRQIALILQPFMPDAMARMLDQLAVPSDQRAFVDFAKPLVTGNPLPSPSPVFPRLTPPE
ncbi:MAG: methionine--tRNA ligase [Alphaproteobacteria bacterium]|nr:methionine--tRNA ligase [Alphaproteobacteria bacterium]